MIKFLDSLKLFLIRIIIFCIGSFSTIYIFFENDHLGHKLLFIFPFAFTILFIFLLSKVLIQSKNNIFIIVFCLVSFLRYVILPFFMTFSNFYGGRAILPPSNESTNFAIILMLLELLFSSVLIYYMMKKNNKYVNENIIISKKFDIYYLFILFTIILSLLFPNVYNNLNFIIPSINNGTGGLTENIVLYCVIISKNLIYAILITKLRSNYIKTKNQIYIILSILVTLLNISIYVGVNRMDIVINFLVCTYLLNKLYGKVIRKYIIIFVVLIIAIFYMVTLTRQYSSFSTSVLINITDFLQVYLGGIYNVALAIETPVFYPQVRSLGVLMMDIFRPMIGPNILLSNVDIPYSTIFFNYRIRPNSNIISQILPMIGQGYIYFGFYFSYIFTFIFIFIQKNLQKIINRSNKIEVYYILSLSSARLGFMMGNNTMSLINDLSMNLLLFFIIFVLNEKFTFRKGDNNG